MHRLNTKTKNRVRASARRAGSLFDRDLSEIAKTVYSAALHFNVTVWTDADAEVLLDRAGRCPSVDPEYLAGTYGIGARLDDIHNDLQALQRERTSSAMLV